MPSEPADPGPTISDLALLRAARVWVGDDPSTLWDVFRHDRRVALSWAWDEQPLEDRSSALEKLRHEHAAQARPDMARVHPSWWLRALKYEPASVRRTVASSLPEDLSEPLYQGLKLDRDAVQPDRPPHPFAVRTVMALWTECLLSDLPERPDDPRAIVALTRFDTRTTNRLIDTAGLAKWSLTDETPPPMSARERERYVLFRAAVGASDSRFYEVAYRDVASIDRDIPHPERTLGLITFARLLGAADPHRVRWAFQHIAYPRAKSLRRLMGSSARKTPMLARWESDILRAAWDILEAEGWISIRWGDA
jgi:hypothetical protein